MIGLILHSSPISAETNVTIVVEYNTSVRKISNKIDMEFDIGFDNIVISNSKISGGNYDL